MPPRIRYRLIESRLAGAPAHHEQLEQLLRAPHDYWKAQTAVGYNPVSRFEFTPDGTSFATFEISEKATLRDVETTLVVMVSRMPGLSIELRIEEEPSGVAGLRLVLGKLESGTANAAGELAWDRMPHHSTLMGSK
jgi:hypothetical protein